MNNSIWTIDGTGSGCVDTAIWMHHMDANEAAGEETRRKLHKNVESSIKQVLATTPHETPTIRTLAPHHENYTSQTNQTRGTLLEKQGRAHKRCTPVDPHIWMCKSRTTSTNLHTATMWGHRIWMIGRNSERGSGISALAARHDDDDFRSEWKINRYSTFPKLTDWSLTIRCSLMSYPKHDRIIWRLFNEQTPETVKFSYLPLLVLLAMVG